MVVDVDTMVSFSSSSWISVVVVVGSPVVVVVGSPEW